MSNENTEPLPSSLSTCAYVCARVCAYVCVCLCVLLFVCEYEHTCTLPPIISTKLFEITRPRPVPPNFLLTCALCVFLSERVYVCLCVYLRPAAELTCEKAWNRRPSWFFGMPAYVCGPKCACVWAYVRLSVFHSLGVLCMCVCVCFNTKLPMPVSRIAKNNRYFLASKATGGCVGRPELSTCGCCTCMSVCVLPSESERVRGDIHKYIQIYMCACVCVCETQRDLVERLRVHSDDNFAFERELDRVAAHIYTHDEHTHTHSHTHARAHTQTHAHLHRLMIICRTRFTSPSTVSGTAGETYC